MEKVGGACAEATCTREECFRAPQFRGADRLAVHRWAPSAGMHVQNSIESVSPPRNPVASERVGEAGDSAGKLGWGREVG